MTSADTTSETHPEDGFGDEHRALGAAPTLPGVGRREKRQARRAAGEDATDAALPQLDRSGVVHVYEPGLRSTSHVRSYVRQLWARRSFLVALAKSDLRGQRSSTVLGSIWGLLDPMFQAGIYYFLFAVIRSGQGGRAIDFLPMLIGGIFLFRLSLSALSDGGQSLRKSSNLMLQASFPRAILPLSAVYRGLLAFLPTVVVFVGVYLWLGAPPQFGLLWLPVLFAIQITLSIGLALATATLIVFFKDAENALNYVQRLLFFTTPVIYPLTLLPEGVRTGLSFQPLFALFANYQLVLGGGAVDPTYLFQSVCWAVGFLVFGGWLFLRYEQEMASRL